MKSNTVILFNRLMKHIFRSPDTIITVAVMPIMMMLLFVYVFGGALKGSIGENVNYINYLLPGILLMAIASGIAYTAYRMYEDVQKGIFKRFNSMPISRSATLFSHVLTSLVSNLLTLLIIFLIALLMGFRSDASFLNWLAVIGILLLFTLALTWVAIIPGILAKTMEGATVFSYPLIFLPFISSAFVPTNTMPSIIRAFAENQPVTSIVNSIRALLENQPVGNDLWIAIIWCLSIMIVAYFVAISLYKRKTLNS